MSRLPYDNEDEYQESREISREIQREAEIQRFNTPLPGEKWAPADFVYQPREPT